jgi:hypothetical protein
MGIDMNDLLLYGHFFVLFVGFVVRDHFVSSCAAFSNTSRSTGRSRSKAA